MSVFGPLTVHQLASSAFSVLLLVIFNGASMSCTISWVYQGLSSQILNDSRDLAITTVSGRQFHGSETQIGNISLFLKSCYIDSWS